MAVAKFVPIGLPLPISPAWVLSVLAGLLLAVGLVLWLVLRKK